MRGIGLIDCNNFFVSCERVFRPDLQKKPVVVLSSNDGCVVARSQEIKDMGITMAVPYFHVKDKLKSVGAEVFSSNFDLYRDISRRVFKIVKSEISQSEQYSIDECFFALNKDSTEEQILSLKERIFTEVGIPVSIGVGPSKTIAKYANRLAKKTGEVTYLSDKDWLSGADAIPLSLLWGVGVSRSREFAKYDIKTVLDLLSLEDRLIQKLFGIEGLRLKLELSGQYLPFKLKSSTHSQKSVTSTRSFAKATTDLSFITNALFTHVNKLIANLYKDNLLASAIKVIVYPSRHGDYFMQGSVEEAVFIKPTRDIFVMEKTVIKLLKQGYRAGVPYKKAGVLLTGLVSANNVQLGLFEDESKTENATETMVKLNNRFGHSILKLGIISSNKKVSVANNNFASPLYTTNWSHLKIVSAKS